MRWTLASACASSVLRELMRTSARSPRDFGLLADLTGFTGDDSITHLWLWVPAFAGTTTDFLCSRVSKLHTSSLRTQGPILRAQRFDHPKTNSISTGPPARSKQE